MHSSWSFSEGIGNHWTALGAELLLGGGGRRVLVYGHLQAAIGVSTISLGRARGGGGEVSVGFLPPRLAAGGGCSATRLRVRAPLAGTPRSATVGITKRRFDRQLAGAQEMQLKRRFANRPGM